MTENRNIDVRPGLGPDLSAAMVVMLVSIPLSMGIAIASGVPPAYGLITAIVGGVVTGLLGGCQLQITGPSAGLAVIVMDLVNRHGLGSLGMVVLVAGALQIVAGRLRLGQWFRAVSPAVIRGMLAGIGVLIFASQFHVMVDDAPKSTGLQNITTIPMAVWKGLTPVPDTSHHLAAAIGILTLVVIVVMHFLKDWTPKLLPAPLVAVVVATAAAHVMELPIKTVSLAGTLLDSIHLPSFESIQGLSDGGILAAALTLAVVASAETLLCSTAVDRMHGGPRTDYDRELFGQGVGNMVCGVLGSLPTTGVITRSTANVEAGARTRAAGIVNGAALLVLVVSFPGVLELIPTASLAGVLVYIGWKLVANTPLRELAEYGRSEVAIYLATVVSIVSLNLLTGLMIGFGLSIAKLLYTFSHLEVVVETKDSDRRIDVQLRGSATFIRLPQLASALESLPVDHEVHLHIQELDYIDHACLDLLANWEAQRQDLGDLVAIEWEELTDKYHDKNRALDPSSEIVSLLRDRGLLDFDPFDEAVARAHILELDPECSFEEAMRRMALPLAERIDSDPDRLVEAVLQRTRFGATVVIGGLAIPHLRSPKIATPLLVLARSRAGIHVAENAQEWGGEAPAAPIHGITFLVSPEGDPARHLHMLSQIARKLESGTFLPDWLAAGDELAMKECLLREEGFVVLEIGKHPSTEPLAGSHVYDIQLPKGCLVAMVRHGLETHLPHASTVLKPGDRVTVIGGPRPLRDLRRRFGLDPT